MYVMILRCMCVRMRVLWYTCLWIFLCMLKYKCNFLLCFMVYMCMFFIHVDVYVKVIMWR